LTSFTEYIYFLHKSKTRSIIEANSKFIALLDKKSTTELIRSDNNITRTRRIIIKNRKRMLCATDVDCIMLQVTHVRQASLMEVVDVDAKPEAGQPTALTEITCDLQSHDDETDIHYTPQ